MRTQMQQYRDGRNHPGHFCEKAMQLLPALFYTSYQYGQAGRKWQSFVWS
jgi:hypothetical protein